MTWIAPPVDRQPEPYVGDERTMLEGWLDYHRQTLLHKCAGLAAAQLATASVEPSALTLHGLVRHMAEVEQWWFRRQFAGIDLPDLYCTDASPDGDFDDLAGADAETDFATFHNEVELARATASGRDLDETFVHKRRAGDRVLNLRWVYTHMIEEYARHNGHADLIRERLDGVTGD